MGFWRNIVGGAEKPFMPWPPVSRTAGGDYTTGRLQPATFRELQKQVPLLEGKGVAILEDSANHSFSLDAESYKQLKSMGLLSSPAFGRE